MPNTLPAATHHQLSLLERQRQRLQAQIDLRNSRGNRYSWARALVFLLGTLLSIILFYLGFVWSSALCFLVSMIGFGRLVALHGRVEESRQRFRFLQVVTRGYMARVQRDWDALPSATQNDPGYEHPFEADLDLVGPYSLHRLLDTTVTQGGSDALRAWLTADAPPLAATLQRQTLVRELITQRLLRNRLTVLGMVVTDGGKGWRADRLLTWLQDHDQTPTLRPWVLLLGGLALLNWLLLGAEALGWVGGLWQVTLALYAVLQFWHGRAVGETFHQATDVQSALAPIGRVFAYLEGYHYRNAPHLRNHCAPLLDPANAPSRHLRHLARIVAATGVQGNPLVALLLNAALPWGLYFAWRLAEEKRALADQLPGWLRCWSELEALSALATYADLNRTATFPTLHEDERQVPFCVTGLGHPLLPPAAKVRNDFTFAQLGTVAILTGSNMAGKSTFLRALGVNLALAAAGGVVDADQLTTRRWRLFTCIKVSDSVTGGISYFYAEVKRLKALLDALDGAATAGPPLFYLIDEIFRGTNNRERLLGSRAYIRALVGKAGAGLVATHDLELVRLAESVPQVSNYHFRDEVAAGRMHFDYILRPGPSPTTNALKIMRSAGLPTETGDEGE